MSGSRISAPVDQEELRALVFICIKVREGDGQGRVVAVVSTDAEGEPIDSSHRESVSTVIIVQSNAVTMDASHILHGCE